jgi:WD40 repeat protein
MEIWDLTSLKPTKRLTFDPALNFPDSFALAPDGRHVAFGSEKLELWSVNTGERWILDDGPAERRRRGDSSAPPLPPEGEDAMTRAAMLLMFRLADVAFLDNERLAAVYHDGSYSVWHLPTRTCMIRNNIASLAVGGRAGVGSRE